MVLDAVVPSVHSVRQGAPRVGLRGFLSEIQAVRVNLRVRRNAALQAHAVLHTGQSSNQWPKRSRAQAPGPDSQTRTHTRLHPGNEGDLQLTPATSSISQPF